MRDMIRVPADRLCLCGMAGSPFWGKNDKRNVKFDNPNIFRGGCGIVRVSTGDRETP